MQRFEALDAWRGVCAVLVVVFHLNQDINWRFLDAPFVHNFDRFVDFFFVLSGFVIATTYEERMRAGYGIGPFMLRRFARIYPLHLATFAAMFVYAVARVLFPLDEFNPRAIFNGGIFDFTAIFTNLLLLHGIGFENHFTWNFPSWSISAEFYTYLIFALIWAAAARWANAITLAIAVASPLLMLALPVPGLSVMTLVQCVYGFAAGVLVRRLHKFTSPRLAQRRTALALFEVAALLLCAAFILLGDGEMWLAPIVFAVAVFAFAFEAGPVSGVLRTAPGLALGRYSYSIYMVHAPLIFVALSMIGLVEGQLGVVVTVPHPDGGGHRLFGQAQWIGDIGMIGMLAVVLAVSVLTYSLIEKPGREWGARASQRFKADGWAAVFGARSRNAPQPAAD